MSTPAPATIRSDRRRRATGLVVALLAALTTGLSVANILPAPACEGTASSPCDPAVPLWAAGLVAGTALCVLAGFVGAGFIAFASTCLAFGAGSIVGGVRAPGLGSFPLVFGLLWIVLGLLQVGFFLWIRPKAKARRAAIAHLEAAGVPADAVVTKVEDTGITMGVDPMVALTVRITTSSGAVFTRTTRSVVPRTAIPRVGDAVRVRFDPADSAEVLLDLRR